MSCVMCHMPCVPFDFFIINIIFFRTKGWSLSVEGLLSTGPTSSSLSLTVWSYVHLIFTLALGKLRLLTLQYVYYNCNALLLNKPSAYVKTPVVSASINTAIGSNHVVTFSENLSFLKVVICHILVCLPSYQM